MPCVEQRSVDENVSLYVVHFAAKAGSLEEVPIIVIDTVNSEVMAIIANNLLLIEQMMS